ncbi:MAG: hypothetical protein WC397_03160 [Candidatus Paceibacterota bacterium]|jgi:signal peptidase I
MKLSKKKIIISIIFFIIIVLALLFFFPSQILGVFFRDIKPIDDSDLTFEKMVVPQEQNAYYDFISLEKGDEVKYPEGGLGREQCFTDEKCLKETGQANKENFAVIDRVLSKQYFVNPDYADPEKSSIFNVVYNDQAILYLSSLQPYYLLQKGENEKAIEAAFKIFEIAQKIKSGRPGRVDVLVAIALEGIGTKAVRDIIKGSDFSSADLLRYSQKVGELENNDGEVLVLTFGKASYFEMRNLVDDLSSGKITTSGLLSIYSINMADGPKVDPITERIFTNKFYLQPNKTKKLFAEEERKVVEAIKAACDSSLLSDYMVGKTASAWNLQPISRFYPNYGGLVLYGMTVANMSGARLASCSSQSQLVMTRSLLALKAYQQDKGRLADSLDVLVPDYLPEVPKDPFSGEALKYSLEKKIIYSIGQKGAEQNLVDDGGDEEKDIVMNIDF